MRSAILRTLAATGVVGVSAMLASACSSSSGSSSGSGPLRIPVFVAYSGANAFEGPINYAACSAAAKEIDAHGGVRGRTVSCSKADSGSDPADAVPAANKLIATSSNILAMMGPNEVAPSTETIFRRSSVIMLSESGDPRYNHSTDPYFFRITPADDVAGVAMAVWAKHSGLKRAAFVFDNGIGAQTVVPSLSSAYKRLGGTIATSLTVAADQASYKAEVVKLLATHPDGIVTETDPQTASTFFSELLQLNGGHLIPIQVNGSELLPPYENAVAKALGKAAMERYFSGTDIAGPTSHSPAYAAYTQALKRTGIANVQQYDSSVYVGTPYDAIIATGLAATAAKSLDPSVYNSYITQVTGAPRPGAVTVHTYAAGVAALKAGKKIVYVGANGAMVFDKYRNAAGSFAAFGYNPADPEAKVRYVIPAATIAQLIKP